MQDSQWQPRAFHVMTKPRGAICNLDCQYCYYLSKELLYPNSNFRMSENLLEVYTRQYIEAQRVPDVTFAWQGGEPTLMGLPFFEQALYYQDKYRPPWMHITNTLQTNAIQLDDTWCAFFAEHSFLIGVSLDGVQKQHDAYRVDKGGKPTFERVMAGISLLKKHGVQFNILTCVHAANVDCPLEIYRFMRDEVQAQFIQFIPVVERNNETHSLDVDAVTNRSVLAEQYGDFLCTIFDEWVRHDVGQVFVQIFDVALAVWTGHNAGLCVFEETCGTALALEHNGDVYSCDHYVQPDYKLGKIMDIPLKDIVMSDKQRAFGMAKRDSLPQFCHQCDVRFVCNGGCPKNRFIATPDGEAGLNYLCAGYKQFFRHIRPAMDYMAQAWRDGRNLASMMEWTYLTDKRLDVAGDGADSC
jgi:uncharacterized protein